MMFFSDSLDFIGFVVVDGVASKVFGFCWVCCC